MVLYNDPSPVAAGLTRPGWKAPPESLTVSPTAGPLAGRPAEL
jgi:hypothetical protein